MTLIVKNLDSGYDVRLRPVPPYAIQDVIGSFNRPKYPMLKLQSEAGPSEVAKALEGSPEWLAWQEENTEYAKLTTKAISQFMLTYGVHSYRKTDGTEQWQRLAPLDWHVPEEMAYFGIKDSDDKFTQWANFIKYELIVSDADQKIVDDVIDKQKPTTKKERDDAIVPFDSPNE